MRRVIVTCLWAVIVQGAPTSVLAQVGIPPIGPPPIPQAQNPPGQPSSQNGPRRSPRDGGRPRPAREMLAGLLDYMDNVESASMEMFETPVTGFGNDALWEDYGRKAVAVAAITPLVPAAK